MGAAETLSQKAQAALLCRGYVLKSGAAVGWILAPALHLNKDDMLPVTHDQIDFAKTSSPVHGHWLKSKKAIDFACDSLSARTQSIAAALLQSLLTEATQL